MRSNKKKQFTLYKLKELPKAVDLCIISTTSDNKINQIKNIFKYTNAKNIIMEKLIAQSSFEIDQINKFFKEKKTNVWVNTQMRTYGFYKKLKKYISKKNISSIKVYGNDWGLACNAIHYMDVYSWILNTEINTISVKTPDKKFHKSKRKGYLEFFGDVQINFKNETKMKIICKKFNKPGKIKHIICHKNEKIYFNESDELIFNSSGKLSIKANQKMIFQQINYFISKILKKQPLDLPEIEYSSEMHKKFFSAINLNFFGSDFKKRKLKIT